MLPDIVPCGCGSDSQRSNVAFKYEFIGYSEFVQCRLQRRKQNECRSSPSRWEMTCRARKTAFPALSGTLDLTTAVVFRGTIDLSLNVCRRYPFASCHQDWLHQPVIHPSPRHPKNIPFAFALTLRPLRRRSFRSVIVQSVCCAVLSVLSLRFSSSFHSKIWRIFLAIIEFPIGLNWRSTAKSQLLVDRENASRLHENMSRVYVGRVARYFSQAASGLGRDGDERGKEREPARETPRKAAICHNDEGKDFRGLGDDGPGWWHAECRPRGASRMTPRCGKQPVDALE